MSDSKAERIGIEFKYTSGAFLKCRRAAKKYIPLLLLGFFFVQSGAATIQESATWDETHSFGLGKYLIKNMEWDVPGSILHPPLSYYLSSIPFIFVPDNQVSLWHYNPDIERDIQFLAKVDNQRGQALLSSEMNTDNVLFYASRIIMIFTALLLGWYIYLWSYAIYGRSGALLSLFFFTFSPNLLAHSHLITPDMSLTAFFFISSFYYWKSINSCSTKYSIIGGIFFGLALMAKFTSVLLFPVFLCILLFYRIKGSKISFLNNFIFLCIGLFILFLGYGFDITPYLKGVFFQLEHAGKGHSSFLMGQYSDSGWWYYYVIAFLIKTPIPTLILLCTALVYTTIHFNFKKQINELVILLPVIVIFCFFSIMHQSIGLRYILPIYPFLFLFLGKITQVSPVRKGFIIILLFMLVWYSIGTLKMRHHYLAYFNESIQGPENGYKYLVDSNLDWGQDLIGLKKYMQENRIDSINLSYFGTDLPDRYGIKYRWLPSPLFTDASLEKEIRFPVKGITAISVTNLQGVYFSNKSIYSWLKDYEPVAKIGNSIFIYNIE